MKKWVENLGIRVLKTMAQVAVGAIGTAVTFQDVNWAKVASTVAMSAIMCILMNIDTIKEVE